MEASIKLYNSLGREKEVFKSIEEGRVKMYCCGPTVYNYAHIGNLRTYIFEDILKKTLTSAGFEVLHCMNITDVGHLVGDRDEGEDKISKEAKKEGKTVDEIATFYTKAFLDDLEQLNISRANIICKATEHIRDMIKLIEVLEKKGHTYQADGNVYFSIDSIKDYGKLAKLRLDDLQAGKRVKVDEKKKNPHDFVLWFTNSKFENQIQKWPSPWGEGYPGWHIECSAMSMKYLGEQFDIHCGGVDAIAVHHTNEIAQSEAATGKKWVNYWLHGEHLLLDDGKMSKSSGNFLTLSSLKKEGISPLSYRFFVLQSHYRKQLSYSKEAVLASQVGLDSIYKKIDLAKRELQEDVYKTYSREVKEKSKQSAKGYLEEFYLALYDDLSTSRALAVFNKMLSDRRVLAGDLIETVAKMDEVLSLDLLVDRESKSKAFDNYKIKDEALELLKKRAEAKKVKDWALCDSIRDSLSKLGYKVIDLKDGSSKLERL